MDRINLAQDREKEVGCCEHGYEHSGSMRFWLRNCKLLKQDSAFWS